MAGVKKDEFRTVTIILPDHTAEKLDSLQKHYRVPADMQVQKVVVDRVDDVYDLVILEPKRKAVEK